MSAFLWACPPDLLDVEARQQAHSPGDAVRVETRPQCPLLARLRRGTVLQVYQRFPCSGVKKRPLWELRENATSVWWSGSELRMSSDPQFPRHVSLLSNTHSPQEVFVVSTGKWCWLRHFLLLNEWNSLISVQPRRCKSLTLQGHKQNIRVCHSDDLLWILI